MKAGGIFGENALGMTGGGVFGQKALSGTLPGGVFGQRALSGTLPGGVFGQRAVSGLGYLTFTGQECAASVVSACKTSCANVGSQGGNVEQCVAACCLVGGPAKAATCQTNCKAYRQDTPEWAQCIQKCQGYAPVDYSSEKSNCEKLGKVFSWLEGGCVNKAEFESCPAGTMYATYPDGSKKCIAEGDVTATKCPAGTTLQTVPGGGSTCVSPVKPTATKTTPKPAPAPAPATVPAAPAPQLQKAGLLSSPMVLAGLAVAAIGAAILLTGDKKGKKSGAAMPSSSRSSRSSRTSRSVRSVRRNPCYKRAK
jgi:hypothetical protein